jgi:hypothetical protein
LCNRAAERVRLHVVRKTAPAVDLHDRDPLPVGALQPLVAADVDLPQLELQLPSQAREDGPRALAQVAVLRVVDDDVAQG